MIADDYRDMDDMEYSIKMYGEYYWCKTPDELPNGWNFCEKCDKPFEWETSYEYTDTCPHCLWSHDTEEYVAKQEWIIIKECM